MITAQITGKDSLCQLIDEYHDNPYCLELIQFFGWHPGTRFSELAVLHALSVAGERRYIVKALCQLVDKGMVKTYSENGIGLFCLTDDESVRQAVLDIARLDWNQWQRMLQQSYSRIRGYSTQPVVTNA